MITQTATLSIREIALLRQQGEFNFGGHKKLKIYGRLDCPSAKRHIAKGHYVNHRVFFKNEQEAIQNGFRPCGCCMKKEYKEWKNNQ